MARSRRANGEEHDVSLYFSDCSLWKKLIRAAGSVVPELRVIVNAEGLRGQAFDATKTCYVDLQLNPDGIDEFDCLTPSQLGFNMHLFHQVMKIGFPGDRMKLTHNDGDEDIHVQFISPRGDRQSDFNVSLVGEDFFEDYPEPPDLDLKADFIVEMKSDTLHRIINAYEDVTDTGLEFIISTDTVEMAILEPVHFNGRVIHNISNDDKNKVKVLKKGDEDLHTQTFHLGPWVKYTKGFELCERVKMYFEDRKYAVLEYDFGDIGYLRFYAAPREDDLTQTFSQSQATQ